MNEVQERVLCILKEIKHVCDKNNITYYAVGGACIGAVRHKGFIPWDDDVDIAIPIEQWDRFWECIKREMPTKYRIYNGMNVRHYRYVFSKIHDSDTSFIEEAEVAYPDAYKGIFVDIMPMAGIPDNEKERKAFCRRIDRLAACNFVRRYPFLEMQNVKRRIAWILFRMFAPFISYHFFYDKWLEFLKKYPLENAKMTGHTWWFPITDNLCFPAKVFSGIVDLPFEGIMISCPIGWDSYLSHQFGDYMTPPPLQERIGHHQFFTSTKISYREYEKRQKI